MRHLLVWAARLITAAGLAVDAFVHADLAGRYDPIRQSISQGNLFRIEAAVAALAALLIVIIPRRETYAFAFVVAASALGAIVLYRYVNVGALGPLPNMYEPVWFAEKVVAAVAEAVTVVAALGGLGLSMAAARRTTRPRSNDPRP
ncbi:MAG TPA: hypothetical protein VFP54_02390 [Acidimicrobiales bacterium]|nr:hypothetical protein [Acidimicrobiales bacterium]